MLVGQTKTPRTVVRAVDHEIELREVVESDAPLALRAVLNNQVFERFDYRLHAGKLYRRAVRKRTDNPQSVVARFNAVQNEAWRSTLEMVKTMPGQTIPPRPQFMSKPKEMGGYDGLPDLLAAATKNVALSRDAEAEIADWRRRADEEAARHIVVGERAYERSAEPLYKLAFHSPPQILFAYDSGEAYSAITRDFRNGELRGNEQFYSYFNADQEEQALELFEARKKPGLANVTHAVRIERWLDEYQCMDTDALEMDRIAKILLNDVSWSITKRSRTRPMILDLGASELINAVMNLKTMIDDRDPAQGVDDDLDVAIERVVAAADLTPGTKPYLQPKVRELAMYSVERWRQRPIVMPSQAVGFGL
ncbi:hypothetical protein HFN89_05605 [Rhizobium laguerreae]|nr:hypothetical protein [Rhizobium laguerreae]